MKLAIHAFVLVFALVLCFNETQAKVLYATRVVNFSSEYSPVERSANRVLGFPEVMPQGGYSPSAWSPATPDSEGEFIEVEFNEAMQISQVAVFENFNPGSVVKIEIVDTAGGTLVVWEGEAGLLESETRVLRATFPITSLKIKTVKIEMNCAAVQGHNQIDAIAVSDTQEPIEAKVNVVPNLVFDSKPENLGEGINSSFAEAMPVISPDGKTLFIVRKDHEMNFDAKFSENDDIWISTASDDGKWQEAQNIGYPLNNEFHNFVSSVTPDGNTVLLGNQYYRNGTMGPGASISYRTKKGWSFPENLEIENFINLAEHMEFNLSNDGKVLLMTIQRQDALGERDIYVSFLKKENKWTEPMNIGRGVNTFGDETSPFLASDGKTLYFATNGLSTFGELDVFMTKRLDTTWTNWSEPLNLGPGINTTGFDAYYTVPASGEYAYFVSEKDAIGETDVFRIKLPKEVQPEPVVLVYGTVYNKKNNKPVGEANIMYETLLDGKQIGVARSEPETGKYKIVLPYGELYGFLALAPGFISVSDNLDLTEIAKYQEIRKDLYLAPIEVGEVVRLNNIFFDYDKATLRPESFPELNRVVEFLNTNSKVEIELSGHTDSRGSDSYNETLSQGRAKAVVDYFIDHGIKSDRLIAKGYGESKPVATNDTDEGRQLNRRVEFEILKK